MEAYVVHDAVQGLGKKSIVFLPINGNSLTVSVPYLSRSVWVEMELGYPHPEDAFNKIELSEDLVQSIFAAYEGGPNILDGEVGDHLRSMVENHREDSK